MVLSSAPSFAADIARPSSGVATILARSGSFKSTSVQVEKGSHRRSSSFMSRDSSFSRSTAASRARSVVIQDVLPIRSTAVVRPAPAAKAERRASMSASVSSHGGRCVARRPTPGRALAAKENRVLVHPTRRHSLAISQAHKDPKHSIHEPSLKAFGQHRRDYSNLPTRRDRALSFFQSEPERRRAFLDDIGDINSCYDSIDSPTAKLASAGTVAALSRIHRRSTPNALDMKQEVARLNRRNTISAPVHPCTPPKERLPLVRSHDLPTRESSSILVTSRARWPAHPPARAPQLPPPKSYAPSPPSPYAPPPPSSYAPPPPPPPPRSFVARSPTDHFAPRTLFYGPPPPPSVPS
ncbi:hypothetical protein PENSPDRAFT_750599 [Peniophora sp. CONT]|nr:hypothetical protein PENSPDRAFT_750599 [Peniophora sp. CONT]